MSEETFEVRFYGVFSVTPEGVEISEPEEYPAMYGGTIYHNDGSYDILDFIILRNREDYLSFVDRLNEIYESEINKIGKVIKSLDSLSLDLRKQSIPYEFRRYISRDLVGKLPRGLHVYEGPRGGLYIDTREYKQITGREFDEGREVETTHPIEVERPEKVETFSGSLGSSDVVYEAEVKEGEVVNLKMVKDDKYKLSFEVNLKNKTLKIKDLKGILTKGAEKKLNELQTNLKNYQMLVSEDVGEEYYKRMWNLKSFVSIRYAEEKLKKGGAVSLSTLGATHVADFASNPDEILYKNIRDSKKTGKSKHLFLYMEGVVDDDAEKFGENIDLFKKHFSDKYGGVTILVPSGEIGTAGSYIRPSHTIVLQYTGKYTAFGTLIHEYLHYIYHMYETLQKTRSHLLDFMKDAFLYLFKDMFGKDATKSKLVEMFRDKFPLSNDVANMVSRLGFDGMFTKAFEDYLLETDFSKIEGLDADEVSFLNKVKGLLIGYRQALEYMGGEEALNKFERLVKMFEKFDGLTTYSEKYWRDKRPNAATEAMASVGDYIASCIRLGEKFTKKNVVDFYYRIPKFAGAKSYRDKSEEIAKTLETAIDFLDTIGLLKWGEGE